MKKYDISDNFRNRMHTVRVTFQYQEYKGHIVYKTTGTCRGLDVMDIDFENMDNQDIRNLCENDCKFNWNNEYDVYELILQDEEGNICELNDIEEDEIKDYVVAIEIVDCKLKEE